MSWQPIETAPACKSVWIHYKNSLGSGRTIKAHYIPRLTVESQGGSDDEYDEYDEENDRYTYREGWYEEIDNWPEYTSVHVSEGNPTHWMPLPPPPEKDDDV